MFTRRCVGTKVQRYAKPPFRANMASHGPPRRQPQTGPSAAMATDLVPMALRLRIRSGGQTGVDRAALDAALDRGVPVGGWCPARRWAEDGPIPGRYPLRETPEADPAVRTRLNVRDGDATLILSPSPLVGGTALTLAEAVRLRRPHFVVDPSRLDAVPEAVGWIEGLRAGHLGSFDLNVAGPRGSEVPGVYAQSVRFVGSLLDRLDCVGS